MSYEYDVSVIIPAKNAGQFLQETLDGLLVQELTEDIKIEICLADDSSDDDTLEIMKSRIMDFEKLGMKVVMTHVPQPGGVGAAKDCAVRSSSGRFLCFNDADDVSTPCRIQSQFTLAKQLCRSDDELIFAVSFIDYLKGQRRDIRTGQTRFKGIRSENRFSPHMDRRSRALFNKVGGFRTDVAKGFPEDLDFFYKCIDIPECVFDKVHKDVVMYRYHQNCASFGVKEHTILYFRMKRLKNEYIAKWDNFTIWSAGKQGKRFFKCLSEEEKCKVSEFCDIDASKIGRGVHEEFDEKTRRVTHKVPIVSIEDAKPPLVVCVKLDLTNGDLERIIDRKGWKEHVDLVYFG